MKTITTILLIWIVMIAYTQEDTLAVEKLKTTSLTEVFRKKKGHLIVPADKYSSAEICCVQQYMQKYSGLGYATQNPIENTLRVACDSNAYAIAVAKGQVYSIIEIADFYTVILTHGKYRSVYSNLENVHVVKGQDIQEGDSLGIVKTTGSKTVLDFQLWYNTAKIELTDWFFLE